MVSGHKTCDLDELYEPAIWSRDTGQRIPYFDRCQLTITDVKSLCQTFSWGMVAILRDSVLAVAIPLAMITIRKSIHGFSLLSYIGMELRYT